MDGEIVSDFLAGGGEMGVLTRGFDWSKTSIGSPETWPQSLRVTVRLVLTSRHPMFIWWGPELIQYLVPWPLRHFATYRAKPISKSIKDGLQRSDERTTYLSLQIGLLHPSEM